MPKTIGERLKELRKEKGLTQVEIAKKMGISQSVVALIESERNTPTLLTILNYADACGSALELNFCDKGQECDELTIDKERLASDGRSNRNKETETL